MKKVLGGTKFGGSGRTFALLVAALALTLGYATVAHAAPGDPDTGFDGDGKVVNDLAEFSSDSGLDVAVQEDGKIVVAGNAYNGASGIDFAIVRYNPDGSPDASFGTGGRVITPVGVGFSHDDAYGVAVRADGKIIAAGFTNENNNIDFAAVRLNANGSLDATFNGDGKVITPVGDGADYAVDVAVQGNKTILAGRSLRFSNNVSNNDFALVRYDNGGALDTTFDADGKATLDFLAGSDDYGEDIAVEPGGKIVIAGSTGTTTAPSTNNFAVARFTAGGLPDAAFSDDGKATVHFGTGSDNAYAYAVGIQEDGKIVVGGRAQGDSGDDFALARLRANGSGDGEFDLDGRLTTDLGSAGDWLWDLAVQDDGRIVVAGTSGNSSSHANFALARYNPDGSLNTSFDHDGKTQTDFANSSDEGRSVALQEDGRIVAAGHSNSVGNNDFAVARYFGGNDATPPRVTAPAQSVPVSGALGASDVVPVKLSWSAADAEGEVTGYALQRSTDGGPYVNVGLVSPSTTSRTLALQPGHNHRFRVRATDDNGNRSVWKYGPRFGLAVAQENNPSVIYAGTWKAQALAGASGGGVRYATANGAKATLSFTGTEVAWVAPKGGTRGKADVFLDGAKVATVDLFSSTALARRVVFSRGNLDPATPHTLEVRSLGTAGRPRVDVDAFVVVR